MSWPPCQIICLLHVILSVVSGQQHTSPAPPTPFSPPIGAPLQTPPTPGTPQFCAFCGDRRRP
jgi:hypothetical protein